VVRLANNKRSARNLYVFAALPSSTHMSMCLCVCFSSRNKDNESLQLHQILYIIQGVPGGKVNTVHCTDEQHAMS
jgi:hypothetical protein